MLEDHAWAVVDFVFDGHQLRLRVIGEGDALGEVVAQQSVGVLVCTALPG